MKKLIARIGAGFGPPSPNFCNALADRLTHSIGHGAVAGFRVPFTRYVIAAVVTRMPDEFRVESTNEDGPNPYHEMWAVEARQRDIT